MAVYVTISPSKLLRALVRAKINSIAKNEVRQFVNQIHKQLNQEVKNIMPAIEEFYQTEKNGMIVKVELKDIAGDKMSTEQKPLAEFPADQMEIKELLERADEWLNQGGKDPNRIAYRIIRDLRNALAERTNPEAGKEIG